MDAGDWAKKKMGGSPDTDPLKGTTKSKQNDYTNSKPIGNSKVLSFWTRINDARPIFTANAKALLAYYQVNNSNNRKWIIKNQKVADSLGWTENTLHKYKRELVTRGVISSKDAYESIDGISNRRKSGCYITVHFDWSSKTK